MGFNVKLAGVALLSLIVAGWPSPAAAQDLSDESHPAKASSAEPASPRSVSWYGYQTFAPDALGLTLFLVAGDKGDSAPVGWTVAGLYLLGAPTVHALHRRPGAVAGSLVLRIFLPLLGSAVGAAIPCHQNTNTDEGCELGGAIYGFGAGLGVAAILDAALLAWQPAPAAAAAPAVPLVPGVAPTPAHGLSLSPVPLRAGAGLLLAGLF